MKWATKRTTTRKEDEAYSLLGLFDIYMPLIYGERERALVRLIEQIDRSLQTQHRSSMMRDAHRPCPYRPSSRTNSIM